MNNVLCPNCGMPNPDDQETCSFCHWPLRSPEDSASIKPGEMPTKKSTADLEPVLPQWLREAREKARQSIEESKLASAETAAQKSDQQNQAPGAQDWLAGLEATAREEEQEELPDWMRGPASPSAPAKPDKSEKTQPHRQEIRWEEEPAEETVIESSQAAVEKEPEDNELLSWMKNMEETPPQAKADDLTDWLPKQDASPAPSPAEPASPFKSGTFRPETGELSNWLDNLAAESAPKAEPPSQSESLPDWLANLPRDGIQAEAAEETAQPMAGSSDWLPGGSAQPAEAEAPTESFGSDLDLPDWMKSPAEPSAPPAEGVQASDWLEPQAKPFTVQPSETEFPDWSQPEPPPVPPFPSEGLDQLSPPAAQEGEAANAPAFLPNLEPTGKDEVDNLFSIEMPDWLSKIEPTGEQKPAPQEVDLSPAELPSWVQAMRPVETVLPAAEAAAVDVSSQPLEEQGPLGGLRGVLPAFAGLALSGKPRTISIRLEPTQEQEESAALLEKILASETEAKPLRSGSAMVLSQRALRWAVAVILIALVVLGLFASSLVPLPTVLPAESVPIPDLLKALPSNAPALLIADYEPALAGEMEAAAIPLLDAVIGLRTPRFTVLSTSPTGSALAERLLANQALSRYGYQSGINYSNLGYLPGGSAGILAFAQEPNVIMPFDVNGTSAWESAATQGVHSLSDYALIILLTDRGEAARAWIEQTEGKRGGNFIVVSSAQSAPMIMPYFLSGQVNGLVSGIRGGAAFTQETDTLSPARWYWNAFHLAALAAVLLIAFGALWNWIAGLRARAGGMEEV